MRETQNLEFSPSEIELQNEKNNDDEETDRGADSGTLISADASHILRKYIKKSKRKKEPTQ